MEKEILDIEKESNYSIDAVHATDDGLQRKLKARHVQMIALGGSIGTGLFIGTGSALSQAGPAGSFISFIIAGTYVYAVLQAIGEMASFIPVAGSYTQFISRFTHPSLGFSANWLNVFNVNLACAIEINATVMIVSYWTTSVNGAIYMSITWLFIVLVNFFPVSIYGEIEYGLTYIKVITIVGWLFLALLITCGISPQGPIGFKYWSDPGAWGPGYGVVSNLSLDQFIAFLAVFILATYTYQGSEFVGLTAGEAENPRKTVPRAIKMVFLRLVVFYVGTMFFIGLTVPYNDPSLLNSTSPTSTSPLVIAVVNAGIPVLPDILNAVILLTVISAGNSQFYASTRVLLAMAKVGLAPKFFLKTTKAGVPYYNCILAAGIAALAFLNLSAGAATIFNWLVNLVSVAGLVIWCLICLSHIRFRKALAAQHISIDSLPYIAPFQPYFSWYGFLITGFLAFFQGFTVFFDFDVSKFFAAYLSIIVGVILFVGHFLWTRAKAVKYEDMDLISGRREVDMVDWDLSEEKIWYKRMWEYII